MEFSILNVRLLNPAINMFGIYRYQTTSVFTFCTELAVPWVKHLNTERSQYSNWRFQLLLRWPNHPGTSIFRDFLDSMGLVNHINFPPHQFKHTLDLLMEEDNNHVITKVIRGHLLSDHHVILSWPNIGKGKPPVKTITYWKIKNLDHSSFHRDIEKLLQLYQLRKLDVKGIMINVLLI